MKITAIVAFVLALLFALFGVPILSVFALIAALVMWRHWRQIDGRYQALSQEVPLVPVNDQIMTMVWTFVFFLGLYFGLLTMVGPLEIQPQMAWWLKQNAAMTGWVECCNFTMPDTLVTSIVKKKAVLAGVSHIIGTAQLSAIVWGVLMVVMVANAKSQWPGLSFNALSIGPFQMPLSNATGWGGMMRIFFAMVLLYAMFRAVAGEPGQEPVTAQTLARLLNPEESQILFLIWQGLSALLILTLFSGICAMILTDRMPGLGWLFIPKHQPEEEDPMLLGAASTAGKIGYTGGAGAALPKETRKVAKGAAGPLLPARDLKPKDSDAE
ncbi:MAG: hypothetical protein Alpg2KO_20960 [Alphaproteobacteria bacterium]